MDPEFSRSVLAGHLEVAQWKIEIFNMHKLQVACGSVQSMQLSMLHHHGHVSTSSMAMALIDATIIAMNMKYSCKSKQEW